MLPELARFFSAGGVPAVFCLLLGLVGMGAAVAQFLVLRKVDLAPLIVGLAAAIMLIGAYAVAAGCRAALEGMAMAAQEMKVALTTAGLSRALNGAITAALIGVPQVGLGAIAITVRQIAEATSRRTEA